MNLHAFNEAKAQFDAQRREQAAIAAQALEMKLLQRDFIKVTIDLKTALERIEAERATPAPPKPATAAPEAKAAVPAPKASPKARPAAPKPTPKRRATPQSIAIDGLEQRLAVIAGKVASLSKRLTK
jgi:cell division septation protein DedD